MYIDDIQSKIKQPNLNSELINKFNRITAEFNKFITPVTHCSTETQKDLICYINSYNGSPFFVDKKAITGDFNMYKVNTVLDLIRNIVTINVSKYAKNEPIIPISAVLVDYYAHEDYLGNVAILNRIQFYVVYLLNLISENHTLSELIKNHYFLYIKQFIEDLNTFKKKPWLLEERYFNCGYIDKNGSKNSITIEYSDISNGVEFACYGMILCLMEKIRPNMENSEELNSLYKLLMENLNGTIDFIKLELYDIHQNPEIINPINYSKR